MGVKRIGWVGKAIIIFLGKTLRYATDLERMHTQPSYWLSEGYDSEKIRKYLCHQFDQITIFVNIKYPIVV